MKNGVVFVSNKKITFDEVKIYNDLTKEGFATIPGRSTFVSPFSTRRRALYIYIYMLTIISLESALLQPAAYFELAPQLSEVRVDLKKPVKGKYALVKFLSAQGGSIFTAEWLGLIGNTVTCCAHFIRLSHFAARYLEEGNSSCGVRLIPTAHLHILLPLLPLHRRCHSPQTRCCSSLSLHFPPSMH